MKSSFTAALVGASLYAAPALAHYRFTSLIYNGATTDAYEYVRANTGSNSPVTDVTSNDLRCNVGGLDTGSSTKVASVAAGDEVGFALDQAIFHPGPLAVYMSLATGGDVKTYDGSGDWFKIVEYGANITDSAINFSDEGMSSVTFNIPDATPAGQYLLRAEQLALHTASSVGGGQFYVSCAQIEVTGSGAGTPSPTIKIPGGYSATDPGIEINIWWPIVSPI